MLRHKLGKFGENITQIYFEKKGFTLWKKNVRDKGGEVDLVLFHIKKWALVCVEVKLRTSFESGYPEDAFNYEKRKRIYGIGQKIRQQHFPSYSLRIDLVSILYEPKEGRLHLKHWPNIRI